MKQAQTVPSENSAISGCSIWLTMPDSIAHNLFKATTVKTRYSTFALKRLERRSTCVMFS